MQLPGTEYVADRTLQIKQYSLILCFEIQVNRGFKMVVAVAILTVL